MKNVNNNSLLPLILIWILLTAAIYPVLIDSLATEDSAKLSSMILDTFHFVVFCDTANDKTLYQINAAYTTVTSIDTHKFGGLIGTYSMVQRPSEPEMTISVRKPMGGTHVILYKEVTTTSDINGAGSMSAGHYAVGTYSWTLLVCKKGQVFCFFACNTPNDTDTR